MFGKQIDDKFVTARSLLIGLVLFVGGVSVVRPVVAGVIHFNNDAPGWVAAAQSPRAYAFDSFFPGIGGISDLSGTVATLNLDSVTMTVTITNGSGAIHDGTSLGQASDAKLSNSVVSRWGFSPPIFGLYTYLGSFAPGAVVDETLYQQGQAIGHLQHFGAVDEVAAYGHGFMSNSPIDRIDFQMTGSDDTTLVGAFVGLANPNDSLGTVNIPGYNGPEGPNVQLDFAITRVPEPGTCAIALLGIVMLARRRDHHPS